MSKTIRVRDQDYEKLKQISRNQGLTLPQAAARQLSFTELHSDKTPLDDRELQRIASQVAELLQTEAQRKSGLAQEDADWDSVEPKFDPDL